MTEQKIIDLFKQVFDKKDNSGTYIAQDIYFGGIAEALLEEFEQEKKDTLKEFVKWLKKKLWKQIDEQDKKLGEDNAEFFDGGLEAKYAHEISNAYEEGIFNCMFCIQDELNQDLENFLKEREK